ncbi:MAG: MAC/perforin domain-containing protein [Erythrobacter sp.]
MTFKKHLLAFAAVTMIAGPAIAPVEPAQAQVPAMLPNKDAVPTAEAMAIDGDWRVNTIGKVIRIEGGRAYAVEGWTHAFVFRVQPDMVTIRNINQTGDDEYVGDDLPLMGKVTMKVVSPDRIEASVPGLFGPVRYTLTRVASSGNEAPRNPPMFVQAGPAPDQSQDDDRYSAGDAQSPKSESYASLDEAFGELRPVDRTFRGCEIPDNADQLLALAESGPNPRDRITDRQFAPVATPEVAAGLPDEGDACWTRIDGVWVQNREVNFDTSRNDGSAWNVEGTALSGLLHGNYTSRDTLFIAPGESDNELWVMSGVNDVSFTRFVSSDDQTVAGLIGNTQDRKVYQAETRNDLGSTLTLDYTAGGDLRMRLGNRQFLRPEPLVESDLSIDDVFVIQYQTDNFAANLKGYNVLTQDPFLLMNNYNGEVFARRGRDEYRIQEKYAVPLGFTLRNDTLQGNVYRRTSVSSETELQNANSSSFGINAVYSVSGAVNSVLAFVPGTGQVADTGYSVGYSSTKSSMATMRQSNTMAQVVGYSRAKSYAIIAEHADTKLSSDFLTAIGDAKDEGNYRQLIERFGTHYAYAVTYGASAKMTRDISTEVFSQALTETEGNRFEAEAQVVGSSIGGFNEGMGSVGRRTSGEIGNEGGRFVAVGGNGSWDSGGYSRGDRVAPILLDLRPLDELLNPINFPDQPEVYTRVRAELAQAINGYLVGQIRPLSNERLISKVTWTPAPVEPEPEPEKIEPIEEWHIYVRQMTCTKPGPGTTNSASGNVTISATGHKPGFAQQKMLQVGCKWKKTNKSTYDYAITDNTPGLLVLRGKRAQMKQYRLNFDFSWQYNGAARGKNRTDKRSLNSTPMQGSGLAPDRSHTTTWVIGPNGRPELKLYLRVKRIK